MQIYEPTCGTLISDACRTIVDMANRLGGAVRMHFNEVEVTAWPGNDPDALVQGYHDTMEHQRREYEASDEYKRKQEEARRAAEEFKRRYDAAIVGTDEMGPAGGAPNRALRTPNTRSGHGGSAGNPPERTSLAGWGEAGNLPAKSVRRRPPGWASRCLHRRLRGGETMAKKNMANERKRRRGRRCIWHLRTTDLCLWWAPSLRRWVDLHAYAGRIPLSSVRYCYTRTSALRAADGLAALGGGTLTRKFGRRVEVVWDIPSAKPPEPAPKEVTEFRARWLEEWPECASTLAGALVAREYLKRGGAPKKSSRP